MIFFFSQKLQFCYNMHFYQNFEIVKLSLGLIISFGALVCKFGNKNVFLTLWHFLVEFFRLSDFQFLQKMGIFIFS